MKIISTVCPSGPMKSVECFAILGVRYENYLVAFLSALFFGFIISAISYFVYSKIKEKEFNPKTYLVISAIVSLVVFIFLSLFLISVENSAVY